MKYLLSISIIVLNFFAPILGAQPTWNIKLPGKAIQSRTLAYCRQEGDKILFTSSANIYSFDLRGSTIGYLDKDSIPWAQYSSCYVERLTSNSGAPLFVSCTRSFVHSGPAAYKMSIYSPETGIVSYLNLADSLGSNNNGGPAVVASGNQEWIVLGRKYVRKIRANTSSQLETVWEKPLMNEAHHVVNAAALYQQTIYAVTRAGHILALDTDGNILWQKNYGATYSFRGIYVHPGGVHACGTTADQGSASLVKFDFSGNVLWNQTPADNFYNALTFNEEGNIVATGSAADNTIVLAKMNPDGALIWRRTYQSGQGCALLALSDGGYFLSASSTNSLSATWAMRADAAGFCTTTPQGFQYRKRVLNNGGFALEQPPSASLFFNDYGSGLEIPLGNSTSTMFTFSPWLAGLDAGGNLRLSASEFGELQHTDYRVGINGVNNADFQRVWHITRQQIADLQRDFQQDGQIDLPPPYDILTWPGKGNPHWAYNLDFTAVTTPSDLFPAPFVDVNNDGKYNIYDGDYPQIKGDQMLWWIITDDAAHQLSHSQAIHADVAISVFAYDCLPGAGASLSFFADYTLLNRSGADLSDSYLGFYANGELGCHYDDYVGCIPESNAFFLYNQDALDGQPGSSCGGDSSFNAQIPIQSVAFLDQTLDYWMTYDQNGGFEPSGDPSAPLEYYNYLRGRWRDGTPFTPGGSGHDPNGITTPYLYPGNPSDPGEWSMCTSDGGSSDHFMVASHGPFQWAANDSFGIRVAFVFHPNVPHPCPDVDTWVKPALEEILQWEDTGVLDATLNLGGVRVIQPGQFTLLDGTQPGAIQYVWSTGATTAGISVNQPGTYTVTVTRATGCAVTESVVVVLESGVLAPADVPEWYVQPNPATEQVEVVVDADPGNTYNILIYNAQGQVSRQSQERRISLTGLAPGLYWVALYDAEGRYLGVRKLSRI